MSALTPFLRDTRERLFTVAAGQISFGPVDFLIYDAADVQVFARGVGATSWARLTDFAVTFTTATVPASFSVSVIGLAAGTELRIRGARIHERTADVTRAGVISSKSLELEFDKLTTVLQEMRRDVDGASLGARGERTHFAAVAPPAALDGDYWIDSFGRISQKIGAVWHDKNIVLNLAAAETQKIATVNAAALKFFTIGAQKFLAIAHYYDGATWNQSVKIYRRTAPGVYGVLHQSIQAWGPYGIDFANVTTGQAAGQFLAISEYYNGSVFGINSRVYKWIAAANGGLGEFQYFQPVSTSGAVRVKFKQIGTVTWLMFASSASDTPTYWISGVSIHQWDGESFVLYQSFAGLYSCYDIDIAQTPYGLLLGFAEYTNLAGSYDGTSRILKFVDGNSKFQPWLTLPTKGASSLVFVEVSAGRWQVAVGYQRSNAGSFDLLSGIWDLSASEATLAQEIETGNCLRIKSFTRAGERYLTYCNGCSGGNAFSDFDASTVALYRFNGVRWARFLTFDTFGAYDADVDDDNGRGILAIANSGSGNSTAGIDYSIDSQVYALGAFDSTGAKGEKGDKGDAGAEKYSPCEGYCTLSGQTITLGRWNGKKIYVNGVFEDIPETGVSLTVSGLAPNTSYFTYVRKTAGVLQLFVSTTAYVVDGTDGVRKRSGELSATMLTRFTTDAAGLVQPARFINWFNRRKKVAVRVHSATRTQNSTNNAFVQLPGEQLFFECWNDEPVMISYGYSVTSSVAGYDIFHSVRVDSTTYVGRLIQYYYSPANHNQSVPQKPTGIVLSEGSHDLTCWFMTTNGASNPITYQGTYSEFQVEYAG